MTKNKEVQYAIDYHEETKHSELSVQMSRHYLDFDDKPRPFKVYPDLPSIPLPQDFAIPASDPLTCIRGGIGEVQVELQQQRPPVDIRTLAQLLFFSAGITREMKFDSGTYYMRAASATGALYPIELYVIISKEGVSGLPAGVYHVCPGDCSLARLRDGDYAAKLAAAAGDNPEIQSAPVTVAFTSMAWRNAWKYGDRSYRHWFWDSGVIAANLLAVAVSANLRPGPLVMGFVDSAVNNLLCLEHGKEAAVVLAPLNMSSRGNASLSRPAANSRDPRADVEPVIGTIANPKYLAVSKRETDHPEIWKIHEASSLSNIGEVKQWLGSYTRTTTISHDHPQVVSKAGPGVQPQEQQRNEPRLGLGDVILRRGSTRRFSHSAISKAHLLTILNSSTRGVPLDFLGEEGKEGGGLDSLVDIYFISNAVNGLAPGRYFYDRQNNSLKQLERPAAKTTTNNERASRNESGYLCLGQSLFSDASAVLFVMADLKIVLESLGNRGYRASQFEAGVVAGKIYLSSYALGLGASGSTFYDDAVTEYFSPHAKDKAAMIAVGVGVPDYNARPGKLVPARLTRNELLSSP